MTPSNCGGGEDEVEQDVADMIAKLPARLQSHLDATSIEFAARRTDGDICGITIHSPGKTATDSCWKRHGDSRQ